MSLAISRRDPALADVSNKVLDQLTKLLYLDSTIYSEEQTMKEWLAKQERLLKDMDSSILRPKDLISRLAISMARHKLPFCPERANLCTFHKALDPRVIRNILILIADECTIQTNRYRSLRLRDKLTPGLRGWLDRIDNVTTLWIGEARFKRLFKCRPSIQLPDCVKKGCEACILAMVGGSALYLTDIRASILGRHAYITKVTGQRPKRPPRLLRIIDSWISFYQADCRDVINGCSESLVGDIVAMRAMVRRKLERNAERARRRGEVLPMNVIVRVRLTETGLPMPREPKFDKAGREKYRRKQARRRLSDLKKTSRARPATTHCGIEKIGLGLYGAFQGTEGDGKGGSTGDWVDHEEDNEEDDDEEEEEEGKEHGDQEYWMEDYRKLVLRSNAEDNASFRTSKQRSERLYPASQFGSTANAQRDTTVTNSSWTSKVEDPDDDNDRDDKYISSDVESPREIDIPSLYKDISDTSDNEEDPEPSTPPPPLPSLPTPIQRTPSSCYSSDTRRNTNPPASPKHRRRPRSLHSKEGRHSPSGPILNPFDQTISMLSSFRRDSAIPLPLKIDKLSNWHKDSYRMRKRRDRGTLALLEGRAVSMTTLGTLRVEEDEDGEGDRGAASCFTTMGWGGLRK